MNFWPFRRKPKKKPKWRINLNGGAVGHNLTLAAAWTTYAGVKVFVRTGDYVKRHPEAKGHDSPFDEECYARDALAEIWATQNSEMQAMDPYLQLLVKVRGAGLIREYVWRFLRESAWQQPADLKLDAFAAWCAENGLSQHRPPTFAFISPG